MSISWLANKPPILVEAAKAKRKFHPALTVLITLGFIIGVNLLASFIGEAYILLADWAGFPRHWFFMFIMAIPTIFVVLYVKLVEKRSVRSVGFILKRAFANYFKGALFATLFLGTIIIAGIALGACSYEGYVPGTLQLALLFTLGYYFFQGLAEEVGFRGFMMVSLSNRMPIFYAILISSITFGVIHITNVNASFMGILNIALIGLFFAFYFLRTNSIWGVAAFHTIYNFLEGTILGRPVSGGAEENPVISVSFNEGKEFLIGGGFGIEEGIIMTAVTLIAIVLVLYLPKKQTQTIH